MSDREAVSLPWLAASVAAALVAMIFFILASAAPDTAANAPQTEASADEAESLRYALTSAHASAAIATDRAEALEREIALLDVTVGNLTDRLERATGAAVSIDASGNVTLLYPPKSEPKHAPRTSATAGDGWKTATASWYGSECFGNHVAWSKGPVYGPDSWGVAHKTLPFGTMIEFEYKGIRATAPVFDRGPYVAGREFDLSAAVARRIGFSGTGTIKYRIVR